MEYVLVIIVIARKSVRRVSKGKKMLWDALKRKRRKRRVLSTRRTTARRTTNV